MWNRDKVLQAFRQALWEIKDGGRKRQVRPRTIALRAHEIYGASLDPWEKRPSRETFRKFATGQLPCPPVVALLQAAHIHTTPLAKLDRQKLRSAFEEAVRRLEHRLLKGTTRPLQVVRRAYDLYVRSAGDEALRPSHKTFENLVYGKGADPEILTLLESALKKRDDAS